MSFRPFPIPARVLIVLLLSALPWMPAQALRVNDYPTLNAFIDTMADRHGFSREELRFWFRKTNIRRDILEAMDRPREASPWHEYRQQFVTRQSARRGLRFWKKNEEALARAQEHYGVAPEIILAIIGVESQYGYNKGRYRVIDALTTLALEYPRRSRFFLKELEQYLLLTEEINKPPLKVKGSYAGAMGLPQFLPSSYRNYAIDFDGDNRRNLFTNGADAIGSIANYFRIHGWRRDEPVIADADVPAELHIELEERGREPTLPIKYFVGYGIHPLEHHDGERKASLIRLAGRDRPVYRFGFYNFYVITRYNRSTNYAMAVTELARMIRKAYMGESAKQ